MKKHLKEKSATKAEPECNSVAGCNDDESGNAEKDNKPAAVVLNERYILDKQGKEEEILSNLLEQMPSFSVEWKSLRGVTQCSCGSPIDNLTRKVSILKLAYSLEGV